MKNKIAFIAIALLFLPITLAQGGGGSPVRLACEDWCYSSEPYRTFCDAQDRCVVDYQSRDAYMLSLKGVCSDYFELGSDDYYLCSDWWIDYYHNKISINMAAIEQNILQANRNLESTNTILLIIMIISIAHLWLQWRRSHGKA